VKENNNPINCVDMNNNQNKKDLKEIKDKKPKVYNNEIIITKELATIRRINMKIAEYKNNKPQIKMISERRKNRFQEEKNSINENNNIINNYINNDADNNDINSNYIINKENGINNIEMRNNNDKYNNYKKEPEYYNKNEIDEFNIDNYVSKYANVEIKDDEDYRQLSSIHEELINNILKEEDVFISQHKTHIDNMVESIKDEMKFLHEVDKPGSDIEEYTTNLDKLLVNEIKKITELRTRLNKFRIMLKDEEVLANIFDDEIILSPEDNKKNFEQSQDQDSLNIEDLGNEGIPNKPKFKFEKK
jgi:hypothetical protein